MEHDRRSSVRYPFGDDHALVLKRDPHVRELRAMLHEKIIDKGGDARLPRARPTPGAARHEVEHTWAPGWRQQEITGAEAATVRASSAGAADTAETVPTGTLVVLVSLARLKSGLVPHFVIVDPESLDDVSQEGDLAIQVELIFEGLCKF